MVNESGERRKTFDENAAPVGREVVSSNPKSGKGETAPVESGLRSAYEQINNSIKADVTASVWGQINPGANLAETLSRSIYPLQNIKSAFEFIQADQRKNLLGMQFPLGTVADMQNWMSDPLRESLSYITQSAFETAMRPAVDALSSMKPDTVNANAYEIIRQIWEGRRALGYSMGEENSAHYATSALEYLATTDDLRYRSTKPVWHYTNGYALTQILKRHQMWASTPLTLNDSSEVMHGFEVITAASQEVIRDMEDEGRPRDIADAIRKILKEVLMEEYFTEYLGSIYFISASTHRDSLTLWRNYANGDGFAVGLSAQTDLSPEGLEYKDDHSETNSSGVTPYINGWYKITYTDGAKRKIATCFLENAVRDIERSLNAGSTQEDEFILVKELRRQVLILASTMKHSSFKDEREVRWMTTHWMTSDQVHYEHARNRIMPILYIKTVAEIEKVLPVKGIMCSPLTQDGIESIIKGLVVQCGYHGIVNRVEKSELPFRG